MNQSRDLFYIFGCADRHRHQVAVVKDHARAGVSLWAVGCSKFLPQFGSQSVIKNRSKDIQASQFPDIFPHWWNFPSDNRGCLRNFRGIGEFLGSRQRGSLDFSLLTQGWFGTGSIRECTHCFKKKRDCFLYIEIPDEAYFEVGLFEFLVDPFFDIRSCVFCEHLCIWLSEAAITSARPFLHFGHCPTDCKFQLRAHHGQHLTKLSSSLLPVSRIGNPCANKLELHFEIFLSCAAIDSKGIFVDSKAGTHVPSCGDSFEVVTAVLPESSGIEENSRKHIQTWLVDGLSQLAVSEAAMHTDRVFLKVRGLEIYSYIVREN